MVWDQAGITSLSELKALTDDRTVLQGLRPDGINITIEQAVDPILHAKCMSGDFGDIEAVPETANMNPGIQKRSVGRAELKTVFDERGLLNSVNTLISESGVSSIQIAWSDAQTLSREGLTVKFIQEYLTLDDSSALSDEDMDAIFDEAESLVL